MNRLFLSLFLIFTACSNGFEISPEERLVNYALGEFAQKMHLKGLKAVGIGGGIDHQTGKNKLFTLVFEKDNLPNIDTGRKLLVETLQEFLLYLNTREDIQEYLSERPFPLKNIHICIMSQLDRDGLSRVSNFEDQLAYYIDNPDPNNLQSVQILEESFEDALRILHAQEGSCSSYEVTL